MIDISSFYTCFIVLKLAFVIHLWCDKCLIVNKPYYYIIIIIIIKLVCFHDSFCANTIAEKTFFIQTCVTSARALGKSYAHKTVRAGICGHRP